MQSEKLITAKELAQNLQLKEGYLVTLCENRIIQVTYSKNEWLICENTQLPCIKYLDLSNNIDQDELNILKGHYQTVDLDELTSWNMSIYYDDDFFGIEQIIISKGIFKDNSGKIHQKYVLSIKSFTGVAEWTEPLEQILYNVKHALSHYGIANFIAIFNNLNQAYKYASLMYGEIPLIEYIMARREIVLSEKEETRLRIYLQQSI